MNGLSRIIIGLGVVGFVLLGFNQVSAQENNPFEKVLEDRYKAMDANKDGTISYDEYMTTHEKSIKASFKRRDKNGDGVITKDEFISKRKGFGMKRGSNPFQNLQ